ncbi:MAG: tryptophan--tRNA ligase [Candidatus Aminicenantes bacterium]|nr:tryptophan--tRNA ligase [Candidatus Aminicenantes bacterium]
MQNKAKPVKKRIVMSGMRPTGPLHLGHWEGALQSWLKLQAECDCYFSIADWHALTTEYADPSAIREHVRQVLLDWLAVGIDPEKSVVFRQSAIKEIPELFLLFAMIAPLGRLERVPTFKEQKTQLSDRDLNTFGFLGYPLLQTIDIIVVGGNTVPVGEDQVFHIELAREMVRRFNQFYGDVFEEPMELLTPQSRLPGLDGRKMSKSYGNVINLSDSAETVKKKILPMKTDVRRQRRSDPGIPQDCPVFAFHKSFSSASEIAEVDAGCRSAAIGCIDCKRILIANLNRFLEPVRERRAWFEKVNVDDLLAPGNLRARERAGRTLEVVRKQVKI